MAKVTSPLLSLDAHGSIAKAITIQRSRAARMARRYSYPGSRRAVTPSAAQTAQRAWYQTLNAGWAALTSEQQADWNAAAAPLHITGWNLLVREHGTRQALSTWGAYLDDLNPQNWVPLNDYQHAPALFRNLAQGPAWLSPVDLIGTRRDALLIPGSPDPSLRIVSGYLRQPGDANGATLDNFTVAATIKLSTAPSSPACVVGTWDTSYADDAAPLGVWLDLISGKPRLNLRTSNGGTLHQVTSSTAIDDGEPHLVVISRASTYGAVYVDGSRTALGSIGSTTLNIPAFSGGAIGAAWGGSAGWQNYFAGWLSHCIESHSATTSPAATAMYTAWTG